MPGMLGPSIRSTQCIWSYEVSTRTLYGFLATDQLKKDVVLEALRNVPDSVVNPSLLLLIFCERLLDGQTRSQLAQHGIGIDNDASSLRDALHESTVHFDEKLFVGAMRSMTWALDEMAFLLWTLERLDGAVKAVDEFENHFHPYRGTSAYAEKTTGELSRRIATVKTRVNGAKLQGTMIKEQAQSMLQTVSTFGHAAKQE